MLCLRRFFKPFLTAGAVLMVITACSPPEVRKQEAYQKGLALSQSGDNRQAILELRNAIQIDPAFVAARYELGVCLLRSHNYEAALSELKRVEEAEPMRESLKQSLAEACIGAGQFEAGLELCQDLVNETPQNALLHDFLSRALLGLCRSEESKALSLQECLSGASDEALKALALDAGLVEPHMTLAEVAIQRAQQPGAPASLGAGQEADVERHFEAARQSSPNDGALLRRVAGLWSWGGKRARAISQLDAALAISSKDTDALLMKAELLFEEGKVDETRAIVDALREEKLSGPRLDFLRGQILYAQGEYENARDQFKKVKDTDSGGYFLALCLEKLGDRQHALSQLEQVLSQTPLHEGARRMMIEMHLADGNFHKAAIHAEELVRAAPANPLGYLLRARVAAAQGDLVLARQAVETALAHAPGSFEAMLLLADLLIKENKLDQALEAVDAAIAAGPDLAVGYLLRSQINCGLKKFAEAEQDAGRASAIDANDARARLLVARAQMGQGNLEAACATYEEALRIAPGNSSAAVALAGLFAARKEDEKALKLLEGIGASDRLYVQARMAIAQLHEAAGNKEAAAAEYERLLSAGSDAADDTVGFLELLGINDEGDAEELASAALQRDPQGALGHLLLANAHAAKADWAGAVEEMNAALKVRADSARLWFRLATLCGNAGRFQEALDALARAHELQPNFEAADLATARILARTGKGDEARALCNSILNKRPNDVAAQVAAADVNAALGKEAEAEKAYRSIINLRPSYLVPYLHLAALLEKSGNSSKAEEAFSAAHAVAPRQAGLYVEHGRFLERIGDFTHARQQYARALEISPESKSIQATLAHVSLNKDDFAEAEKALRARIEQARDDLPAALHLAMILERQGKDKEAAKVLADFLMESKNPEAAGMELSRLFASKGEFDKIEQLAQSLLQSDQTRWMGQYALGTARAGQNDPQGALTHFAEAARLNDKVAFGKHAEGVVLGRLNRFEEALAAFAEARAIDAGFMPAYSDAALICLLKGDFSETEELCNKALALDANAVKPNLFRAAALAQTGREPAAMDAVDALLGRDPGQAVAALSVVDVLAGKGRYAEAVALSKRCVDAAPQNISVLMRLGTAYEQAGNPDLALAQYRRVIEIEPDFPMAHNNLAWLLSEQGKLDEALSHAQHAHALLPQHPALLDTLGWITLKKGDAANAIPLLEASCKAAPKEPSILYHLGRAYSEAGRSEDGRKVLTEALAINTHFAEAADAQKVLSRLAASRR